MHCIIQALNANYLVRTTLRSLSRKDEVLSMLKAGNATNLSNLSFITADLTSDENWNEAVKDCTYILHVASPFPKVQPKNEEELIKPAKEGTLRVLKAARTEGVRRVVLTSSFGAIGYGHKNRDASKPFTEEEWTDPEGGNVTAYLKSKTIAERAAWDFINSSENEEQGGKKKLELSVINPSAIFGPVVGPDTSPSIEIISRMMKGTMPGCPALNISIVDVRDAAELHLLAMTHPAANGERFICASPPLLRIKEISGVLKGKLGEKARKAPTISLPGFVLKILAIFDGEIRTVLPELGVKRVVDVSKARRLLGWDPRSNEEAVIATAESLVEFGLVD